MKKALPKWNKGFTLMELLIVLAIISILASIVAISYRHFIDKAKETVCRTNLTGLSNAIKLYIAENDALPAILGDLGLDNLEKGFALAMKDSGWWVKFSHILVKINIPREANAQFLTYDNLKGYGTSQEMFYDPADETKGISYGINSSLIGKSWGGISDNEILVGDSDSYVFTGQNELVIRHKRKSTALGITKGRIIVEISAP